jgi:hypothetical protein
MPLLSMPAQYTSTTHGCLWATVRRCHPHGGTATTSIDVVVVLHRFCYLLDVSEIARRPCCHYRYPRGSTCIQHTHIHRHPLIRQGQLGVPYLDAQPTVTVPRTPLLYTYMAPSHSYLVIWPSARLSLGMIAPTAFALGALWPSEPAWTMVLVWAWGRLLACA